MPLHVMENQDYKFRGDNFKKGERAVYQTLLSSEIQHAHEYETL